MIDVDVHMLGSGATPPPWGERWQPLSLLFGALYARISLSTLTRWHVDMFFVANVPESI